MKASAAIILSVGVVASCGSPLASAFVAPMPPTTSSTLVHRAASVSAQGALPHSSRRGVVGALSALRPGVKIEESQLDPVLLEVFKKMEADINANPEQTVAEYRKSSKIDRKDKKRIVEANSDMFQAAVLKYFGGEVKKEDDARQRKKKREAEEAAKVADAKAKKMADAKAKKTAEAVAKEQDSQ